MIGIFRPAVESPVESEQFTCTRLHEDRPRIASPDAICGPVVEVNILAESVGFAQELASLFFRGGAFDDQVDALVPAQVTDDFRVDPRNRFEFARPVVAAMGPGNPSRLVGLPFRGQAWEG